jgi:hypothetical protein
MLALGLGACQKDEEHPPEYVPDFGTPRSCLQIQEAGVSGSEVIDDGGAARCAVDGLECPLEHATVCEPPEIPVAECVNLTWTVGCVTLDAAP